MNSSLACGLALDEFLEDDFTAEIQPSIEDVCFVQLMTTLRPSGALTDFSAYRPTGCIKNFHS